MSPAAVLPIPRSRRVESLLLDEAGLTILASSEATGVRCPVCGGLDALRTAARQNLVLYTALPFFQRLFRASGFAEEAALMERGDGMAGLSDRLLDAICLLGPLERCQERLAAYRAAGVGLPILYPPIGIEGARGVIQAFRR